MKPKHFQNLFSKSPLFEFVAKASSDSLLWFCVDDIGPLSLDRLYEEASRLLNLDQQTLFKRHHLLVSKKQYEQFEIITFKGFLANFLDNSNYKEIKLLNKEEKSNLCNVIPVTYQHLFD